MEGLAPLLPLQYGLHESIPKLTETLRLSMNANDKALEAALNRIDYNAWMKIGKEVADPVIRSMCDHVAKELARGSPAYITAGAVTVALILCGAYCAGRKFGTLTPTQKVAVGATSAGVGALAGAGITKIALGAAVAGPVMLVGAALGMAAVGGTAFLGHRSASSDRAHQNDIDIKKFQDYEKMIEKLQKDNDALKKELADVKGQLSRMEGMLKEEREEKEALKKELTDVKGQLSRMETMMEQMLANQQQNGNAQ